MASNGAPARSMWSGKWAFILAAAASAVGLGNLWRFPYLAAKYGGGIFLITYLVLVVTFGFALMMLETALGRTTGQSAIGAFRSLSKKYAFIGYFTSLIPFIIVPYYCVIGGWVTQEQVAVGDALFHCNTNTEAVGVWGKHGLEVSGRAHPIFHCLLRDI